MATVSEDRVGVLRLKELEVVTWMDGRVRVGEDPESRPWHVKVRVWDGAEEGRVSFAELVVPMVPMRQAFIGAGGVPERVQMFRYVGEDGVPRRRLWCGSCGHVEVADWLDLCKRVTLCCRKCEAVVSAAGCPSWHAFGRCSSCMAAVAHVE